MFLYGKKGTPAASDTDHGLRSSIQGYSRPKYAEDDHIGAILSERKIEQKAHGAILSERKQDRKRQDVILSERNSVRIR